MDQQHKDIDRLVDAIVEARITLGESLEPTFDDYRNLVFQMFDILDDADVVESLNRLAGYDVPKLLEVSYFEWGEQCHDNDNRKRP